MSVLRTYRKRTVSYSNGEPGRVVAKAGVGAKVDGIKRCEHPACGATIKIDQD